MIRVVSFCCVHLSQRHCISTPHGACTIIAVAGVWPLSGTSPCGVLQPMSILQSHAWPLYAAPVPQSPLWRVACGWALPHQDSMQQHPCWQHMHSCLTAQRTATMCSCMPRLNILPAPTDCTLAMLAVAASLPGSGQDHPVKVPLSLHATSTYQSCLNTMSWLCCSPCLGAARAARPLCTPATPHCSHGRAAQQDAGGPAAQMPFCSRLKGFCAAKAKSCRCTFPERDATVMLPLPCHMWASSSGQGRWACYHVQAHKRRCRDTRPSALMPLSGPCSATRCSCLLLAPSAINSVPVLAGGATRQGAALQAGQAAQACADQSLLPCS